MTILVELAAAAVAGLVIALVTAIVERLGPVIGGVLGCVPHVAVVGSIGFILQTASSDEFRIAMLSMPLGMLCNSFFFLGVRIASLLPNCDAKAPMGRLVLCLVCGALGYAGGLAAIMLGLRPKEQSMAIAWLAAAAAFVLELLVGLFLMYLSLCDAKPGAKPRSSCKVLVARGLATFCVMLTAMALARSLPALAGILANLPVVLEAQGGPGGPGISSLGAAMVVNRPRPVMVVAILWIGYGEEVALGALGPMTIGMLSAAAYAMLASELMLLWHPALGCVVSWLVSVAVITKPTLMILQHIDQKSKEPPEVAYDSAKARSDVSSDGSNSSC